VSCASDESPGALGRFRNWNCTVPGYSLSRIVFEGLHAGKRRIGAPQKWSRAFREVAGFEQEPAVKLKRAATMQA